MKSLTLLKRIGIGFGLLVVLFAAAQLIRPRLTEAATDPGRTIQAQPGASSELGAVLDRSCGECHSNALSSRWYTRVAPFSWAIARGATEGRKAVNFAEWASYPLELRRAFLLASCADARNGTMPMPVYLRVRPDAALSAGDVEIICRAAP